MRMFIRFCFSLINLSFIDLIYRPAANESKMGKGEIVFLPLRCTPVLGTSHSLQPGCSPCQRETSGGSCTGTGICTLAWKGHAHRSLPTTHRPKPVPGAHQSPWRPPKCHSSPAGCHLNSAVDGRNENHTADLTSLSPAR